jgi:hypothetical protein
MLPWVVVRAALVITFAAATVACEGPPTETDVDRDHDGVPASEDCDDDDPARYPGAEDFCDGRDNDCDDEVDEDGLTTFNLDSDGDGYGDPDVTETGCAAPEGYVEDSTDCDDTDPDTYPGAPEACYLPDDTNCDGSVQFEDADHDYYAACEDCDDSDPDVNPGETDICNYRDDDCDGEIDEGATTTQYRDADGDGYGDPGAPVEGCLGNPLEGFVENDLDCDDADPETSPMAPDPCDGIDNNCNGQIDETEAYAYYRDADGDGFGNGADLVLACSPPEGFVDDPFDCDDSDPAINPGAIETCNHVDDDCDLTIDEGC